MRRREFLLTTAAGVLGAGRQLGSQRPLPSAPQLEWQRDELALFLHFGVNTFTDREWGDGKEDPAIFNPTNLDARQWAKAARAGGFKMMILTAKHHDGFCLWPTKTTKHSVVSSPFRSGKGDVVREFVDACRAEGLRTGVYLSPWDRNHPTYGDSARYNDVYSEQLAELLTQYGPMAEVWFDGANGEGPNGKRQVYDWPRVWGLVKKLQPEAVIFSDAGPDVRWCGNERGVAGDPNWSTVDPAKVPYPGVSGPGITDALQHGDRDGTVWRPAEADVSIRRGWFYHPAQDAAVRTVDQLVDLYFSSVGRNSKLLLNVPPTKEGLLHETDVARLAGMHDRLRKLFAEDLTQHVSGKGVGFTTSAQQEIDFGRDTTISIVRLAEDITRGQMVERYRVLGSGGGGDWRPLSSGTTIGHARIDRVAPTAVRRLRVIAEGGAPLGPVSVGVY
jgi:alpha-L-fucosidase